MDGPPRTVHDDIDGPGDHPCRHGRSGGTAFGGDQLMRDRPTSFQSLPRVVCSPAKRQSQKDAPAWAIRPSYRESTVLISTPNSESSQVTPNCSYVYSYIVSKNQLLVIVNIVRKTI